MPPVKATAIPNFVVKRSKGIISLEIPLEKNSSFEQWFFIISDQHFDSTHCDRDKMKQDLETVVKRKAIILSVGDFFDIMGSKKDPRSTKSELRPEYLKSDYFSCVIDDAVDYLDKYAKYIAIMCQGNHETAIIKNNEIDILHHLVARLNDKAKSQIIQGEYEEFVRVSFVSNSDNKYSKMFYLNHGWGGASPVTGGTIHHHRVAEYVKADIICMGHLHTTQIDERMYWEPNNQDTVLEKSQLFIRTGGYKKGRVAGETTWETVKGIKPKPRGGIWLRFYWDCLNSNLACEAVKPTF